MNSNNKKKVIEINLFKLVIILAIIVFVVALVTVKSDIKSIRYNTGIQRILGDSTEVDAEGPILMCPWNYGDANEDRYVNEEDIALLESVIAGNEELTEIGLIQADVNNDKKITESDITAIRNYINGEGELPVGDFELEVLSAYNITETEIYLKTKVQDDNSGISKMIWYHKKESAEAYKSKEKVFDEQGSTNRTTLSFILSELTPGTTYNIYFEIYDVAGNKTTSEVLKVTTLEHEKPDVDDIEGPVLSPDTEGLEKNLNAYDITNSGFNVKISAQDELSGLSKVIWYWKKQADTQYRKVEDDLNDQGTNIKKTITFTLSNLLSETNYNIYVEVFDVKGNMSRSDEITVTTLQAEEVEDTENPTISSTEGRVDNKISASDITENSFKIDFYAQDELSGLNKYVIYYKVSTDTEFMQSEKIAKTQGSTLRTKMSFSVSNLASNTIYIIYVEVYDMAGNKKTSEFLNVKTLQETTQEPKIESEKYDVSDYKITNISPDTKLEDLLENLDITAQNYRVVNNKNEEITSKGLIGTGSKIILNDEIEYTFIVKGDTDGDGKTQIQDLLAVNKHRLGKVLLEGIYFKAGDVNGDNAINIQDLLQINKARLGKITL